MLNHINTYPCSSLLPPTHRPCSACCTQAHLGIRQPHAGGHTRRCCHTTPQSTLLASFTLPIAPSTMCTCIRTLFPPQSMLAPCPHPLNHPCSFPMAPQSVLAPLMPTPLNCLHSHPMLPQSVLAPLTPTPLELSAFTPHAPSVCVGTPCAHAP